MKIVRSYHVRKSFVVEATNKSGENKIRASLCLKVSVLMFYIQAKLAIAKKASSKTIPQVLLEFFLQCFVA
jgi:hypothetical protein